MRRPFGSFYARLSAIFLLLILALGAAFVAIAFSSARRLYAQATQQSSRDYAADMAGEIEPLVAEGFSPERVGSTIHYMMVLNPLAEIYILDGEGTILAYFLHPSERIAHGSVDLAPIREFIATGGSRLILGEDPRHASRWKPFSAAPLSIGDDRGYVYIILGGEQYDMTLDVAREAYILRAGAVASLLAILATLAVGLLLFLALTRRLRLLSSAVRAFERGELARRVQIRGTDEIGSLGRAFNDMAATIEGDVEKLRQAERMRRELVGNISHDLRSPIASMRAHLETMLLKDASLSGEERRRLLETGLKNAASLERLVADLFELARLDARQREPEVEPFQLSELAQDVTLKMRSRAEEAGVSLCVELCRDLPEVRADIGMIERLFTNLLDNALRFTPAGGTVRVALCARDGGVRVDVTDTGSGIDPEDLPRIFDRFYRADKSRARSSGGAGLGLAIAKQIVELHGGRLEVQSALGRGTHFHFALSAAPDSRSGPPPPPSR